MTNQAQTFLDAVLALPEAERLWLVERLLETLPLAPEDDPKEAQFLAELDRRAAEVAKDPSRAIPWTEVVKDQ
jgi:putative addiction module component (TIGR02574 family)